MKDFINDVTLPCKAITICKACDADWKTSWIKHTNPIPKGTEILIEGCFQNFEGVFYETHYQGEYMSLYPEDVKILEE